MPEIKPGPMFRVNIIESERGWGSKVDEVKYFDNEADATAFCKKYNADNTETTVPDWYMYASYVGKVS